MLSVYFFVRLIPDIQMIPFVSESFKCQLVLVNRLTRSLKRFDSKTVTRASLAELQPTESTTVFAEILTDKSNVTL